MGASELKEEPLSKRIAQRLILFHFCNHKMDLAKKFGGKQYICKICDKSLQTRARLNNHEKSHTGERPEKQFACEECKYTTNTKAYLKDHIRRMHLVRGVGWMCVEGTCENKPKTFVNNRLLLQHKKDHQNLLCPSCTKTFNSKRNLNRHRKVVHKPEQPDIERRLNDDSMNFVPAQQVSVEELLNLSTFDFEGAFVLPLDPLTS